MVSQSTGRQDSPVNPWKGISDDSGNIEVSSSFLDTDHPACQLDIRLTRHKAAWINTQCVQQQLQELPLQVPTVGDNRNHLVADATSPLGFSLSSLGNSLAETSLSEDTVDSIGSASAHGSSKKTCDFSLTSTEKQVLLSGCCHQMSLPTGSKSSATSPHPEADSAFFKPSHLTASADEGAVQVNIRATSLNNFSPEAFVLPVDVEKENAHFYVADMIISAMEKMKCDILNQQHAESWRKEEASGSLGTDQTDSEVTFYTNIKQEPGSSTSSDSGYDDFIHHTPSAIASQLMSPESVAAFWHLSSKRLFHMAGTR
ncbi:PREDICTED: uncharacterized protein KIAA0226-like [Galeopterus variegatus]|uniref:Uncharacterized protein KIAA0226-like n=1 Tax=Galeopterus variegatus TaxID=482537 RepID=A0ABM0SC93_GALVR|nr:PREDICTED: uncharacterized protein KIAA0226-like [Galeopterus variegatus]